MTNELIILNNWEKAKQAIAICKDIDELKAIRDKAEALKAYAKQAKESLVVQNNICEIKLRCERKMGEIIPEQIRHGGSTLHDVMLKDIGLSEIQSSRYQTIAGLSEKSFEEHIIEVKQNNEELTTIGLYRLAKKLEPKPDIPPLPEGKYSVIYADPPWPYPSRYDEKNLYGTVNYHYPVLKINELCEMKIKELLAENAVLFIWVATNFLEESFEVIKAWGFEYKSNMAWVKEGGQGGIGWYVWGDHELLLIATKGSYLPKNKKLSSSVIKTPRQKHSQKPTIFYEIIEKMYPNDKYIELFARQKRQGWQSFGNEI